MSVQSIGASDSASTTLWTELVEKQNKKEAQENQGSIPVGRWSSAGSVGLSPMAQILAKLDSLSKSDPDQFTEMTASIAAKLEEAAASAQGRKAEFLSRLAEQFSTASASGDVSALQPRPRPHRANYIAPETNPPREDLPSTDPPREDLPSTDPPRRDPLRTIPRLPLPLDAQKGGPPDEIRTALAEILNTISTL